MSIGIGPFLSKSPAVSSSVSKSRSKPSEEAEWSAGGLTSNGRSDSDVVCPRSPHASRGRSGVPGVCSRTLGGLIPNALGMSPVTFIGVRSVAAASTWAAARKGSKIFPSGHSTAEDVGNDGVCAMRGGRIEPTRDVCDANRFVPNHSGDAPSREWCVHVRCASGK